MTTCFKFPRWIWSMLDNVHSHYNLWHAVNCIMILVKRTISKWEKGRSLNSQADPSLFCRISHRFISLSLIIASSREWLSSSLSTRPSSESGLVIGTVLNSEIGHCLLFNCHVSPHSRWLASFLQFPSFSGILLSIIVLRWHSCGDCGWSFRVRVWG